MSIHILIIWYDRLSFVISYGHLHMALKIPVLFYVLWSIIMNTQTTFHTLHFISRFVSTCLNSLRFMMKILKEVLFSLSIFRISTLCWKARNLESLINVIYWATDISSSKSAIASRHVSGSWSWALSAMYWKYSWWSLFPRFSVNCILRYTFSSFGTGISRLSAPFRLSGRQKRTSGLPWTVWNLERRM